MNNIIVRNEKKIELNNETVSLNIEVAKLDIYISGKVVIEEHSKREKQVINIYLAPDSALEYNKTAKLKNYDLELSVLESNNSNFNLNYSFSTKDIVNLKFNTNINGNNNNAKIVARGVSEGKGIINIEANGYVIPSTKDNVLIEDIRCLTLGSNKATIVPNMLINTNEVMANHFITVSGVSKSELFYLNSKGISDKKAVKLIKKGFLKGGGK